MNRELYVTKCYVGRYPVLCSYCILTTELQQNIRTYGQQHSSVHGDVISETDFRWTQVNSSQEGVNLKRKMVVLFCLHNQ
jgi:hypothetical protein